MIRTWRWIHLFASCWRIFTFEGFSACLSSASLLSFPSVFFASSSADTFSASFSASQICYDVKQICLSDKISNEQQKSSVQFMVLINKNNKNNNCLMCVSWRRIKGAVCSILGLTPSVQSLHWCTSVSLFVFCLCFEFWKYVEVINIL